MHRALTLASALLLGACGDRGGLDGARADAMAACDRYLECSLQANAADLEVLLAAYGPDGSCWQSETADKLDFCRRACDSGRANIYMVYDDIAACGPCETAEHCTSESRPVCDVVRHECVACLSNVECTDPALPHCVDHACVECTAAADCPAGQVCVYDACTTPTRICEPDERRCTGDLLERCDADGLAWSEVEDCADAGEQCDPDRRECAVPVVCEAGADYCAFDPEAGKAEVRRCNADGTAYTIEKNCVDDGLTCFEGACVITEYGPCSPNGIACAKSGDVCVEHGTGMVGEVFAPYYYYCSSECDGYTCPESLPPSASLPGCDTGKCLLGCNIDQDVCPPGMRCSGDGYSTRCAWATYD